MATRKNILLLFSKVPEVGKVKTRLTILKDGIFQPEVASALYHCMLFDVVEISMAALTALESRPTAVDPLTGETLTDEYELWISTTPEPNVAVMEKLFTDAGEWPRSLTVIADTGASFDEHYNDAFNQAWAAGADCLLSMGADMPALTVPDIVRGFEALQAIDSQDRQAQAAGEAPTGGIVLAPDQAMGVSVVGWTRGTEFTHDGVYYNETGLTVLPAYIEKAREAALPAYYLPPIPDVDTMGDLMHAVTVVEALNYCADFDGNTPPWRTAQALQEMGWAEIRVPPNDLRDPRDEIDV